GTPTWSLLPPAPGAISARRDHTTIYDPVRDRLVVFGGYDGALKNDVWAFSLSGTPAWTPIVPGGTLPTPRFSHAATYDSDRDELVIFGGYDGSFVNDVWALPLSDPTAWRHVEPVGPAPAGRDAMSVYYDAANQRMLLFGGWDGLQYRDDL